MCGRFAMDSKLNELVAEFVAQGGRMEDWEPKFSIAPTTRAPIVREAEPASGQTERVLELARWDWPKPPNRPKGPPIINARLEKLDSRFWVGAYSNSRCIVPMRGYFEWTGSQSPKTAHFLHGDGLLAAAGLTWTVESGEESHRVFVVVTREARDAGGEVHDRMPAFLPRNLWDQWLDPTSLTVKGNAAESRANRSDLLLQLEESSAETAAMIRTHVVDSKVNSTRKIDPTDPTLIVPVGS